jgi:diadenosine tetraphosphate (Ap4A) HIT family hydrolase
VTLELPDSADCVFCAIVAGNSEARWEVRPDAGGPDDAAIACFHNQLKWERVMLLIVPTRHMTQKEFWSSSVLVDAASLAVKMGDKHCGSDGYRVISNFGRVAHQSQAHGHMHVVSGTSHHLSEARIESLESVAPGTPSGMSARGNSGRGDGDNFTVREYDVDEVRFAVEISPPTASSVPPVTQREFWGSELLLQASTVAQRTGSQYSPEGYRLISSFDPANATESTAGNNSAGLFLLGGGQLGLYV